jgi:hypothetical protein
LCISAEVSFGLSGTLLGVGSFCVVRALQVDRRLIPLALVPMVFSIQQFCEGCLWVGLNRANPGLVRGAGLAYLSFALFFWPVWASLSTLPIEPRKGVRWFLCGTGVVGALVGAGLFLPLVLHPDWLTIEVVRHSIYYNTSAVPFLSVIPSAAWEGVYLAAVAIPFMVSPERRLFHLGLALVLSAAVSHIFFRYAGASIWCFFAAALSLYLSALFLREGPPAAEPAGSGA